MVVNVNSFLFGLSETECENRVKPGTTEMIRLLFRYYCGRSSPWLLPKNVPTQYISFVHTIFRVYSVFNDVIDCNSPNNKRLQKKKRITIWIEMLLQTFPITHKWLEMETLKKLRIYHRRQNKIPVKRQGCAQQKSRLMGIGMKYNWAKYYVWDLKKNTYIA